jgi:hypothetical protein
MKIGLNIYDQKKAKLLIIEELLLNPHRRFSPEQMTGLNPLVVQSPA